jgi:hypothetical protein
MLKQPSKDFPKEESVQADCSHKPIAKVKKVVKRSSNKGKKIFLIKTLFTPYYNGLSLN